MFSLAIMAHFYWSELYALGRSLSRVLVSFNTIRIVVGILFPLRTGVVLRNHLIATPNFIICAVAKESATGFVLAKLCTFLIFNPSGQFNVTCWTIVLQINHGETWLGISIRKVVRLPLLCIVPFLCRRLAIFKPTFPAGVLWICLLNFLLVAVH